MDKIEENVIDSYIDAYLDEKTAKVIKLTSAVALRSEQKERIIAAFINKVKHAGDYEVIEVIDESVLGGVRLESDNFYFDNTLSSKLTQMEKHILQGQ